jgi:hydrogenase maturation protein HypF
VALKGEDKLKLEPEIMNGNIIQTGNLALTVFNNIKKETVRDLGYSVQSYIARSLAEVAIREADRLSVEHVGFTGGVAYNDRIVSLVREIVISQGLKFYTHNSIPPGDGGLSFGQAIAAGYG